MSSMQISNLGSLRAYQKSDAEGFEIAEKALNNCRLKIQSVDRAQYYPVPLAPFRRVRLP